MLFKKIFFLSLWLLVFLIMQVDAQVVGIENRLTLAESIKLALENNKSILLAKESILGAEAKVDESRSPYFPQLRLEANYIRLNTFSTFKFEIPGLPAEEIKFGTQNNYNAQVSLNQSLFNWGRNAKIKETVISARRLTADKRKIRDFPKLPSATSFILIR